MKVTWITYDWSTDTGGKGVASNAFMNYLVGAGHQVTLLDLEMSAPRDLKLSRVRKEVSVVPYWVRSMAGTLLRLPAIVAQVAKSDVTVIGAAPNVDLVLLLALVPFKFVHRAKLFRVEFTNPETYLSFSKLAPVYRVLGKLLFPRLDHSIAPSHGAANQLVERYGVQSSRASMIPWPCVPDNMAELVAEEVPEPLFNAERPALLAVSVMRLSMQDKDFVTLLDAFAKVRAATGAELAVLGAGDPGPIETMIADRNLTGAVHLMGERRYPYPYVGRADVFMFASKYEGSPLVIAEALACGCPVVATDCDFGPRELIRDGESGFLVPVKDSTALSDRTVELMRSPALRERFSKAGLAESSKYGVTSSGKTLTELLEEITGH